MIRSTVDRSTDPSCASVACRSAGQRGARRRSSRAILGLVTDALAPDETRIDRWLCAVRLVKTRPLATRLCDGGHVLVNGSSAKPSTKVRAGDRVEAFIADRERIVEVLRPIESRVSAAVAVTCYVDHSPPVVREATPGIDACPRRGPAEQAPSASWSACVGHRAPERLRSASNSGHALKPPPPPPPPPPGEGHATGAAARQRLTAWPNQVVVPSDTSTPPGRRSGLGLSARDVPGEGERRPVQAVGRDQGGCVRATAHREEPMTVADERPVRLQAAVRASARRRPEGREGLERLPVPAIGRSPPQRRARGVADPLGDHAVVADHELHRIREGRRPRSPTPRSAGGSASSASGGRRPTTAPPLGPSRLSSTLRSRRSLSRCP